MKKKIFSLVLAFVFTICLCFIVSAPAYAAIYKAETFGHMPPINASYWAIKTDNSLWIDNKKMLDNVSEFNGYSALKLDGSLWGLDLTGFKLMLNNVLSFTKNYAITKDGALWQCRDANNSDLFIVPEKIIDNVEIIYESHEFNLAKKRDGTLWLWSNTFGASIPPTKIMDSVASVVGEIEVDSDAISRVGVLKTDGSLWCCSAKTAWQLKSIEDIQLRKEGDDVVYAHNGGYSGTLTLIKKDGCLYSAYDGKKIGEDVKLSFDGYYYIKNDGSLWNWLELQKLGDDALSIYCYSGYTPCDIWLKKDGTLWAYWLESENKTSTKIADNVVALEDTLFNGFVLKSDGSLWQMDWGDSTYSNVQPVVFKRIMDGVKLPGQPSNPIDSASSWARDGITGAVSKGFVPYDLQSNYTNVITRAEFCRMAVKWVEYKTGKSIDTVLAEKGVSRNPNAFSDTKDEYILAAYALGITSGTGGGKFAPSGQFNREQAAGMIRNTCKAAGMNVSNVTASEFADIGSASSWAVDGINFVSNAGIMSGTGGGNFSPKATYTREQSIVTFNNINPTALTS